MKIEKNQSDPIAAKRCLYTVGRIACGILYIFGLSDFFCNMETSSQSTTTASP